MTIHQTATGSQSHVMVVAITIDNLSSLINGVNAYGAVFRAGPQGDIEVVFPDGGIVVLARSGAMAADAGITPAALADALNTNPAYLFEVAENTGLISTGFSDANQDGFIGSGLPAIDWSMDGDSQSGIVSHLFGEDQAAYVFSIDLVEYHSPAYFARINALVGPDIAHLPGLPDEDYPNGIDPRFFHAIDNNFVGAEPPAPQGDSYFFTEDTPVSGNVFDNDYLPNGQQALVVGTAPAHGTVVLNPDGSFTYTPDLNYSGNDSFTYIFTDPILGTQHEATVVLTQDAVADTPTVTVG
ncbi:MAG: cadherin-like domain-containing protein, partial [Nitratireductor sp.]|nr:cadherin-like domain-containing protein [Nitratireductor sp.]